MQNVAKISIPIVRGVCPVIGVVTVTLSVRSPHCRPERFYTRAESAARRSYCTLVLRNSHCSLSRHVFSCIKPFRLSSRCPSVILPGSSSRIITKWLKLGWAETSASLEWDFHTTAVGKLVCANQGSRNPLYTYLRSAICAVTMERSIIYMRLQWLYFYNECIYITCSR